MRGDDAPAGREADPGLALPADGGAALAPELGHRGREVAAEGGDDGRGERSRQAGARPPGAKGADRVDPDQVLSGAVAHRVGRWPEQLVEHVDAILHQRVLVARERGLHVGDDVGQIDLGIGHRDAVRAATGASTTPACCR